MNGPQIHGKLNEMRKLNAKAAQQKKKKKSEAWPGQSETNIA